MDTEALSPKEAPLVREVLRPGEAPLLGDVFCRENNLRAEEVLPYENVATLSTLSKEELISLIEIQARNLIAIDGVWFQAIEGEYGMDAAMLHDVDAWARFTSIEAGRIKAFLSLPDQAGLEGFQKALAYKSTTLPNKAESYFEDGALIFRILSCRVQNARERKGMPLHPCKAVGVVEYEGFARAIDSRIKTECLSCFPEKTDESCCCAWKFSIDG